MFRDRLNAAHCLARELRKLPDIGDSVLFAIPRGGLPIGGALARELGLPLDVILAKKIGHPLDPECAIGAVSMTGMEVEPAALAAERIEPGDLAAEVERIRAGLRLREAAYRGKTAPSDIEGRTALVVDDGAATGRTMLAAIDALRSRGARRIVAAIPVAPKEAVELLATRADQVVCLESPEDFMAIGQSYHDFAPVPDEEAAAILAGARGGAGLGRVAR